MSKYKILSLDGGGVKGITTAVLLSRLNEAYPDLLGKVDLIAGTSTGGLTALALANGKTPEDICGFYHTKGPKIFKRNLITKISESKFMKFLTSNILIVSALMDLMKGVKYSNKNLQEELKNLFGNVTLGELKKKVVIPSFDLDNEAPDKSKRTWKPKIFHNFPDKASDGALPVKKIALYTSAAPTYFPSADGYIDGGVFANNPSVVALAQAIFENDKNDKECAKIDEIVLLSMGTGVNLNSIKGESNNWGKLKWMTHEPNLIDILMEGVSGISDYQCKRLLRERYERIEVKFSPNKKFKFELDGADDIKRMDEIASNHSIDNTITWLKEHWK